MGNNRKRWGIKLLCYRYNITGLELPNNIRWRTWQKATESDRKWQKVTESDRKQWEMTESDGKRQGIKLLRYRYNITSLELPNNIGWWTWQKTMESDRKWQKVTESDGKRWETWETTESDRKQQGIKLLRYRYNITRLELPNNIGWQAWQKSTESDGKQQKATESDRKW